MPGPVTDPRAAALLCRHREAFPGPGLPVPVEAIAEDLLGLRVLDGALHCSGLLLPAEREIWVNEAETAASPGRRRFTIAHELGHWVCQVCEGHSAPVYCRDTDLAEAADRALEREANVFAAELLMPEPDVRGVRRGASVADVAARFAVSTEAMHWRLYNFGLVERPDAREQHAPA
ncbi:MAG: ImmA/IrrE family metallo-endopeptidase [Gaiellales bacterium]